MSVSYKYFAPTALVASVLEDWPVRVAMYFMITSVAARKFAMTLHKSFVTVAIILLLSAFCFAQDKKTGTIKGKVRVERGSPSGVAVILLEGDREVSRALTDKRGEFVMSRVT